MENSIPKKIAIVTGDLTIDWNLALMSAAEIGGTGTVWWKDTGAHTYQQRGGAALLADLVTQVAENLRAENAVEWEVRSVDLPREQVFPGDGRFHHSHAVWARFKGKKEKVPAWRVKEFLGLSRGQQEQPAGQWQIVKDEPPEAALVILDDADQGFRENPELWPRAVREDCPTWILVKMARPVAQGKLWEHLHSNCADRVIVVMTVNDLRRTEVQVSRELSWERTAHDLYWELTHNPGVNALSRCAHVVVSFDNAGAFLLSRSDGKDPFKGTLFFDPAIVEGMWNQAFPGGMIGYTSCLTAGIARRLMLNNSSSALSQGIQSGLAAMRLLHQKGYTEPGGVGSQAGLEFPVSLVAEKLGSEEEPLKTAAVPSPVRFLSGTKSRDEEAKLGDDWTILQELYSKSLEQVARNIVLVGVERALDGVPLGQFGGLITADRREVENFRSIRSLIGEYCNQSQSKPLSIAVFGPPGSGKSFAVKQIAASVRPEEIKPLGFNLSQLGSVEDLYDAFHQVRDVALSGKIPLVFWDEFDSAFDKQPLGWLRYFLAPMQDGEFLEGQITHPMGRCIFVFAGGICCRMEDFTSILEEKEFIQVKGPDFVSRLKGYVNIFGPNQYTMQEGAADPYYMIRRAIILRVILTQKAPIIFSEDGGVTRLNIDRGVLRALLHIGEYKHGVRSIESIIAMSSLTGKAGFERSSLPPEAQLNLHVNGREFLALVQELELEGELLEKLAEEAHAVFCEGKRREGWTLGPKDETEKTHPMLIPYAELDEIDKEANRVNVRNIPAKLAAAGYIMVPARSNEPPIDFPGDDLEKLARLEHDLWMKSKFEQGFVLGKPTEDNPRRNEYLVEWEQVPEKIKQSDRDLVQGIPRMLAKVGYAVVKLNREQSS